jgi:Ca2+-binding EF-hand superfamily protein
MFTLAALACGAAFAQEQAPAAAPPASSSAAPAQAPSDASIASIFTQLDTDHDGRISQAEAGASSVVTRSFAQADADKDGAISRDEFMSSFTTRAPATPPPALPTPPAQ